MRGSLESAAVRHSSQRPRSSSRLRTVSAVSSCCSSSSSCDKWAQASCCLVFDTPETGQSAELTSVRGSLERLRMRHSSQRPRIFSRLRLVSAVPSCCSSSSRSDK